MPNGKVPLRAMKPSSCARFSSRSLLFLGLAIALTVHVVIDVVPPKPPVAHVPSDTDAANVAAKGEEDAPHGEQQPQPVAARELGGKDAGDASKVSEVAEGKPSAGDEENDKEEDDFGVISRGRKRELPKNVAEEDDKKEGAVVEEEEARCLPMIFYDKPMKTGSTAVTSAVEVLLNMHNEKSLVCKLTACGEYAVKLCANERPKIHLIDHIAANVSTALCLKNMGYYSVTSVRDPTSRWNSAYLFNQGKKGNHYGISYKESYEEFMRRIPNCSLLKYYDRGAGVCRGDVNSPEFQKRIADILQRFDEILDLYGDPITDLHKRLVPFLAKENVSKRPKKISLGTIPKDRIAYEQALYDALVKRRFELAKQPKADRVLCKKPRIP